MVRSPRIPVAIPLFVVLLTGCAASWHAELARAEKYERENRPAAALAIYDALLPLAPRNDAAGLSQLQLKRGEALWRLDRPAEGFAAYQKALDADPQNLHAHLRLAEAYFAA